MATFIKKVGGSMVLAVVAAGCGAQHKTDLSAEESAIRRADAEWLSAASAHDLERTVPFFADDATIFVPGQPAIVGKEAIRKHVSEAFATSGFSITWKTEKIDVSASGDVAYSVGTNRISVNTPDGKSVTEENRGVVVWKKQPDGSWKCVLDVMSPAGSPQSK